MNVNTNTARSSGNAHQRRAEAMAAARKQRAPKAEPAAAPAPEPAPEAEAELVLAVAGASRRPRLDWTDVDLGQRPDAVIARELGVSREAVRRQRERRHIPAFVAPPAVPHVRVPRVDPWAAERRLGTMGDFELAGLLGVSMSTVVRARIRLGVPAFTQRGRS